MSWLRPANTVVCGISRTMTASVSIMAMSLTAPGGEGANKPIGNVLIKYHLLTMQAKDSSFYQAPLCGIYSLASSS